MHRSSRLLYLYLNVHEWDCVYEDLYTFIGIRQEFISVCWAHQVWFLRKCENEILWELSENSQYVHTCMYIVCIYYIHKCVFIYRVFICVRIKYSENSGRSLYTHIHVCIWYTICYMRTCNYNYIVYVSESSRSVSFSRKWKLYIFTFMYVYSMIYTY